MVINNSGENRDYLGISENMVKFISKEGASQFPTIVFLMNRMFLSDEMKIAEHLGLPKEKLKINDDFCWRKSNDYYSKIASDIKQIITGIKIFSEEYSPDTIKNISKAFHSSYNDYYIIDNKLYKGNVFTEELIEIITINIDGVENRNIDISKIKGFISLNSEYDFFWTDTYIYRIHKDSNSPSLKYTSAQNVTIYKLISCGSYVIFTTTNKAGLITDPTSSSSFTIRNIEYKSVTTTSEPDSEGNTASTTVYNGLPSSNNLPQCVKISDNEFDIGDSTTCGRYNISSFLSNFQNYMSTETTGYMYSFTYKGSQCYSTSDSTVINGITFNNISDPDTICLTSTYCSFYKDNKIYLYGLSGKFITSFDNGSGIPENNTVNSLISENDIIHIIGDKKASMMDVSKEDYPIKIYPIGFTFKTDSETTKVDAIEVKLSIGELISLIDDNSVFNSKLSKGANDKTATFFIIHVLKNNGSKNVFYGYGTDNRNAAALEIKEICKGFDVGP